MLNGLVCKSNGHINHLNAATIVAVKELKGPFKLALFRLTRSNVDGLQELLKFR